MNKNKEWLRKEVRKDYYLKDLGVSSEPKIMAIKIENLIDQLDEPELPAIPKFVADYLEGCKENERNLFEAYEFAHKEVSNWIFDAEKKAERIDIIAKVWLDGYTIEQEKRYRLKLKNELDLDIFIYWDTQIRKWVTYDYKDYVGNVYYRAIFTGNQLSGMDETGFARILVEEEDEWIKKN